MRISPRQFRIGELAAHLKVERFVVRFWEKEFNLSPSRSEGGQRFYEAGDLEKFKKIKHLLYNQGYTISGAKKMIKKKIVEQIIPSTKINSEIEDKEKKIQEFSKKCCDLKDQLIKMRKILSEFKQM